MKRQTRSQNDIIIRRYYIVFGLIGAICLFMSAYWLVSSQSGRKDLVREKTAYELIKKLDMYIMDRKSIPASLADTTIPTTEPWLRYRKSSDKTYEICITFLTKHSDASTDGVYSGVSYDSTDFSVDEQSTYLRTALTTYELSRHKKGETCYSVTPYISPVSTNYNPNTIR